MVNYCLILLLIVVSMGVNATQGLPTHISIAVPEIPPHIYYNDKDQLTGTLVEKLKTFSYKTGIKVSIDVMTWSRALAQVKNNKHDALMPVIKTSSRAKFLVYPELALINFKSSVLIQHKSKQSEYDSLKSLIEGKVIAKARSMMMGNEIDAFIANGQLTIVEVNSVESAIQMLALGRVDFVATDKSIALSIMDRLLITSHFNFITVDDKPSNSYLAFSQHFSAKYDVEKIMQLILAANDNDVVRVPQ